MSLTSCEDLFEDGTLKPDGSNPSLTINKPTNNQTILATNGLRVNITAVDKDKFNDVTFQVVSTANEKSVVSFHKATESSIMEFDTLLTTQNFTPGNYKLSITATDKRTNVTVQEIKFSVR